MLNKYLVSIEMVRSRANISNSIDDDLVQKCITDSQSIYLPEATTLEVYELLLSNFQELVTYNEGSASVKLKTLHSLLDDFVLPYLIKLTEYYLHVELIAQTKSAGVVTGESGKFQQSLVTNLKIKLGSLSDQKDVLKVRLNRFVESNWDAFELDYKYKPGNEEMRDKYSSHYVGVVDISDFNFDLVN